MADTINLLKAEALDQVLADMQAKVDLAAGNADQTAADREATGADVVAAEGVRDATLAAALTAGVYVAAAIADAKAAGLAVAAEGETFYASGADVDYIGFYKDVAGVAVEQPARLAKFSVVEALIAKLPDGAPVGYAWAVIDRDGRMAIGLRDGGIFEASEAAITMLEVSELGFDGSNVITDAETPDDYVWAVRDQDNRVAVGVKDDGAFKAASVEIDTINGVSFSSIIAPDDGSTSLGAQNFMADVVHVICYGQSLSVGAGTATAITTSQRFDNLKFVGGVRAQDADESGADTAAKYGSLVPLIETGPGASSAYETPMGGATDSIKELITAENGIIYTDHQYQLLASAPGDGGRTIAELSNQAGIFYTRLVQDVAFGLTRAAELGKSYKVSVVFYTQGESDETNTDFATELSALRLAIDTDVKAITGQTEDVQMICYQLPRPRQSEYFLEAMENDPLITLACPTYQIAKSDGVHLTAQSSKIMGAYYGVAYKRRVIDQIDDWKPCMALSHFRQGKICDVKFNVPSGSLTFDTTLYPAQINNGFRLFDTDGTTELTISDVSITKHDTVRVTAAATIPAGALLRYGSYDPIANATDRDITGGNLRDQAGDSLVFNGGGLNHPMHNWALLFARTL